MNIVPTQASNLARAHSSLANGIPVRESHNGFGLPDRPTARRSRAAQTITVERQRYSFHRRKRAEETKAQIDRILVEQTTRGYQCFATTVQRGSISCAKQWPRVY